MISVQKSLFAIGALTLFSGGLYSYNSTQGAKAQPKVDYNRDIRPILSKCFTCHGPSAGTGQAGLRLDHFDSATTKLPSGKFAIAPGNPEKSELIRRVFSKDQNEQMPPPDTHKTVNDEEKQLLNAWIEQGARYKEHWAFVRPVRPVPPAVKNNGWIKNPIDNFICSSLEQAGLKPESEADKRTLIRRVTLDLTGLPPTQSEVQNFVSDTSPRAYESLVDRLLASPRYGERMAMDWMDYARYADSNGYQADFERYQSRWRDWVIDAFNKNMPYDQFTVEQIAGDLLPNPTSDQILATAFNRNHRINTEGGVIAEEWRVETVIDRVETTTAVWIGLTAGCARCHDHKYDPFSQKDFYKMFAYFNNVPESGTGEERPINHPPTMKAPTAEQAAKLALLTKQLQGDQKSVEEQIATSTSAVAAWKPTITPSVVPTNDLEARYELSATPKAVAGSVPEPKVVGQPGTDIGRSTGAVVTNNDSYLSLGNVADVDVKDNFSFGAWINPVDGNGAAFARMDSPNAYRGWDMFFGGGRPMVHIINKWPENALKITARSPIPLNQYSHVFVTYNGTPKPEGLKMYVNGKSVPFDAEVNSLSGTIRTTVPLTVGRRTGESMFNGKIDDLVFYRRVVTPEEVAKIADVNPAKRLLQIPIDKRTKEQQAQIARFYLSETDSKFKKLTEKLEAETAERNKLDEQIPAVMVMQEMPKPRDCFVLVRGQYDKHGDKVEAGLPSFLPPIPSGFPNNRLGFAKWLVSEENPLTARVTMNRLWERFFGAGLVSTVEDFGTRAEFPTHPELLDYLATELHNQNWNLKAVIKELVMSATYRQSSNVSEEKIRKDPQNRLLSRGPRFRLQGEVLRDQALFVSGLLVEKIGGPGVRPYQPDGVWDELNVYGNLRNYKPDMAQGSHRRSLYTIWKRTAAPPNMVLFDVPTRETCRVHRSRTDTPLQALTLMNDVTYVEAARVLAQKMMREGGKTLESRLTYGFNQVLSRFPTGQEIKILVGGFQRRIAKYRKEPDLAKAMTVQGNIPVDPKLNPIELAAYTVAASTLLNLDETLSKE